MTFSPQDIKVSKPTERQPIIALYSPNGYGKTTFIASMGKPFIIDTEDKCYQIEAPRYVPKNLQEIVECLSYLYNCAAFPAPGLVIDTLDWLEKKIHEEICAKYKVQTVVADSCKELNYSKGYTVAANMFLSSVLPLLEAIRLKHDVPIILCAQAKSTSNNDPSLDDGHDHVDLRLQTILASYISDKVDAKIYINRRHFTDTDGNVHPDTERYLVTDKKRGISAKNNMHLPDEIIIGETTGWQDFLKAVEIGKARKKEIADSILSKTIVNV